MDGQTRNSALGAWRAAVAALAMLAAGTAIAADPPKQIPIETFFRKVAIAEAAISPNGRHVAMVVANKDDVHQVVVLDTETLKAVGVSNWKYQDVSAVRWVSDQRLLYHLTDFCTVDCKSDFKFNAGAPQMYSVDRDGKNARGLGNYAWAGSPEGQQGDDIFAVTTNDLVRSQWSVFTYLRAYVLNTRTGEATWRQTGEQPIEMYVGPDGEPRVIMTRRDDRTGSIEYREKSSDPWVTLTTFDFLTGQGRFRPIGQLDNDTLYVVARGKGALFEGLYTYNIKTRTMSAEPLVVAPGFDVAPRLVRSKGKVIGIRFETDAETTIWLEPDMKQVQQQVDKLLPGTINLISIPARAEVPMMVIRAFSDREPGQFYLFDTKSGTLKSLGRARPDIEPKRMAQRDFVRYKARDGREIPAWVTVPADGHKGPRPTVVLVHGGPYVRGGHWRWEAQTQFLASRGYVVVEPEFRGSTGYGHPHFQAGWKQWGLAMQNDIADAARWAIAKGLSDQNRICIAGASYGGYAALMGLVNDPDLYRCGVNWVGVTDIELLYDSPNWTDSYEAFKTYGMPVLIADKQKDAAQIKATSPVQQAARIKAPVLLAYGHLDSRVELEHGTKFRDAIKKTNNDVEWIEYKNEGHGFFRPENKLDFWTRVEKFLHRNIGAQ